MILIQIATLFFTLVEADRERGFHLDIEDYLSGILTLASELVSKRYLHKLIAGLKPTKNEWPVACFPDPTFGKSRSYIA